MWGRMGEVWDSVGTVEEVEREREIIQLGGVLRCVRDSVSVFEFLRNVESTLSCFSH